jgi:hypothetical protein
MNFSSNSFALSRYVVRVCFDSLCCVQFWIGINALDEGRISEERIGSFIALLEKA